MASTTTSKPLDGGKELDAFHAEVAGARSRAAAKTAAKTAAPKTAAPKTAAPKTAPKVADASTATLTAEREAAKAALQATRDAEVKARLDEATSVASKAQAETHGVAYADVAAVTSTKSAAREYIAGVVKAAREAAGLSKKELADRMLTSEGAVARIEDGRTNPTTETLANIAQALGAGLVVTFAPGAADKP